MSLRTRIKKLEHRATLCRACGTPLCCPQCSATNTLPDYREQLARKLEAFLTAEEERSKADTPPEEAR